MRGWGEIVNAECGMRSEECGVKEKHRNESVIPHSVFAIPHLMGFGVVTLRIPQSAFRILKGRDR
jgi:hypothetical protein